MPAYLQIRGCPVLHGLMESRGGGYLAFFEKNNFPYFQTVSSRVTAGSISVYYLREVERCDVIMFE